MFSQVVYDIGDIGVGVAVVSITIGGVGVLVGDGVLVGAAGGVGVCVLVGDGGTGDGVLVGGACVGVLRRA